MHSVFALTYDRRDADIAGKYETRPGVENLTDNVSDFRLRVSKSTDFQGGDLNPVTLYSCCFRVSPFNKSITASRPSRSICESRSHRCSLAVTLFQQDRDERCALRRGAGDKIAAERLQRLSRQNVFSACLTALL